MQTLAWLYDAAPWVAIWIVVAAAVLIGLALLVGDGRRSMELSEYDSEEDSLMK